MSKSRGKRQRTALDDIEDANAAQPQSSETDAANWPGASGSIQVLDTLEAAENGSPHDGRCYVCGGINNLLQCYTCRRCYHERCLGQPPGHFFYGQRFFCEVCIGRQWHQNAPPTTPPSTPLERPRAALPTHRPNTLQSSGVIDLSSSPSLPPSQPPLSTPAVTDQQPLMVPFVLPSQNKTTPPPVQYPAPSAQGGPLPLSAPTGPPSASRAIAPSPRNSKSRLSTLSVEIDDAITVLLRELEYLAEARAKISQLEALVVQLRQDAKINENALILAQRHATSENQRHQGLGAENERLKREVERLTQLLNQERSQPNNDRIEVENWKREAQVKQAELDELKGRLRSIL
ncbi:hypothetical protein PT974_12534 [Cladobotryum mycophilum]|uniref:Zinc finger PHD-type domain-containing protein n=1 Tax=Cladobotryum mycophilum TaxID=491253 RepID=A0ABR0S979_9HYPO